MHPAYEDITSRIADPPKWFDANGVPRYDKFTPNISSNVYADEVALLKIACQQCGQEMFVEVIHDRMMAAAHGRSVPTLVERMMAWDGLGDLPLHYGDPPRHEPSDGGDCIGGDTMNCIDLRLVELWRQKLGGIGWDCVHPPYTVAEMEPEEVSPA